MKNLTRRGSQRVPDERETLRKGTNSCWGDEPIDDNDVTLHAESIILSFANTLPNGWTGKHATLPLHLCVLQTCLGAGHTTVEMTAAAAVIVTVT